MFSVESAKPWSHTHEGCSAPARSVQLPAEIKEAGMYDDVWLVKSVIAGYEDSATPARSI